MAAAIDDHPASGTGAAPCTSWHRTSASVGLLVGLRTEPSLEVVAIGATASDARVLLSRDDIDVLLLDVRLEGGNGLQVLSERGQRRRPFVLVLSSFDSTQYVAAASRFGASGFLLKTTPLMQLVEAIELVAAGSVIFDSGQLTARYVTLTPRERDITALVMEGLTNKEIGGRLGTSKKAIEQHLSDIFTRYGIRGGRIELAMRASLDGWLELEASVESRKKGRRVAEDAREDPASPTLAERPRSGKPIGSVK